MIQRRIWLRIRQKISVHIKNEHICIRIIKKRNSSGGKSGVRTVGTAAEIKRKSRKRKNGSRRFTIIKKDYLEAENLLFLSILGILIVSREERKK